MSNNPIRQILNELPPNQEPIILTNELVDKFYDFVFKATSIGTSSLKTVDLLLSFMKENSLIELANLEHKDQTVTFIRKTYNGN